MHERVHQNPSLIFSVGTQVVALSEVRAEGGRVLHPRGAVGMVLKAPMDLRHSYWVRFLERLRAELQQEFEESHLPETPTGAAALHDLLVRLRLKQHVAGTCGRRV